MLMFVRREGKKTPPVELGGRKKDLKKKASYAKLKVAGNRKKSKEASS